MPPRTTRCSLGGLPTPPLCGGSRGRTSAHCSSVRCASSGASAATSGDLFARTAARLAARAPRGNEPPRLGALFSIRTTLRGSVFAPSALPSRAPDDVPQVRSEGSGRDRDPPFSTAADGFFVAGCEPCDDQEGVGEQAQGYVAVPGVPPPHLVVVQAHLALGLRKAFFHRPTVVAHPNELFQGRSLGTVCLVETAVLRVIGAPANQEPTPHAFLGVGGQVQAGPLPRAPAAGVSRGKHLGKRLLAHTLDEPLYLLLTATKGNSVGLGDHHGVGSAALLQPSAEGVRTTVERIRHDPPGGYARPNMSSASSTLLRKMSSSGTPASALIAGAFVHAVGR